MLARRRIAVASSLLIALSLAPHARADDTAPGEFVLVRAGSLPIILTAPHGGRLDIPGVTLRDPKDEAKIAASLHFGGLAVGSDLNTDLLVQRIAAEVERLTGKAPYLVMARFARRIIDANRPAKVAYDDPKAQPYYDFYHDAIRRFVAEVRRNHPKGGLLIDVHGQSRFKDDLVRGTLNGRSVSRLIERAGAAAVTGPDGIFGRLEANGFSVFPANSVPPSGTAENAGYSGGHTVNSYGSHRPDGVDAILFEFGITYRQKAEIARSAERAATAIVAFHDAYLK